VPDSPAGLRFLEASDQSLLVRFAERASDESWRRVWDLVESLERARPDGILHWQPASASVLVRFDPLLADAALVESRLRTLVREVTVDSPREVTVDSRRLPRLVEVPVAYGGEHGPDLADVAAHCGLSMEELVARHSAGTYRVDFFGFAAGFAYLSGLPSSLATPRLTAPRVRVPPGSVAIGGTQTGIYPAATPGGWRLIGRSPRRPARFAREAWTLFQAGDEVRFVPIPAAEFARLSEWS
jgi:KipI family sensor histidine kinase inhibitor